MSSRVNVVFQPGVCRTEIACWIAGGTDSTTLNVDLFGRSFGTRRNHVAVDAVVALPRSRLTVAWAPANGTDSAAAAAASAAAADQLLHRGVLS